MKRLSRIFSVMLSLLLVAGIFQLPVKAAPAVTPVVQFKGIGDGVKATLTFNYNTMQIEATYGVGGIVHNYFEGEYFGMSVYDNNRKLVINDSQIGNAVVSDFVSSMNGLHFDLDYVIQIRHQEPANRLVLNGGFSPSSQTTKSEYYQVTDSGLVKINVAEYGPGIVAESQMIYAGDSFDPLAAVKAYDIVDGDISGQVQVTFNNVDSNVPGQYAVSYQVTDSNGKSATGYAAVTVMALPTLSVTGGSVYAGDTLALGLDYSPEAATISYRALNPDIAVMDGPGTVLGVSKGTAQFEVKLTTPDGVKVLTQTATVTVKELPTVHVGNVEFYVGDYQYASTIYTPSDAVVTYSSANPDVATVADDSRITGVSPGITQMTATATTADGEKSASTNFEVAVLALPEVTVPDQTIYLDETLPLNFQQVPDTATATFSSADESVLTIDASGKMTPHALGTASVGVQLVTIDGKKNAAATATVTVLPLPTITAADQTLYAGESVAVVPEFTPENAVLSYQTGDSAIAAVDNSGNLTGVKAGATTLTITATTADGRKSASTTVRVTVLAMPVITAYDMSMYVGDREKIATLFSPNTGVLSYVSADTKVATVDSKGLVTAVGPGTTGITVRVTTADGKYYSESTATVTVNGVPVVDADDQMLFVNDTLAVVPSVSPDNATLTYSMDDTNVATVDADGVITGVSSGTAQLTITATTADGKKSASTTVQVTVMDLPTVSGTDLSLYAGDTVAANIETTPADNVLSYESGNTDIATVDATGKVTGVAAGTTTVTVTATTAFGQKVATAVINVTVMALPTVQVTDKYLYAGDAVNAEATATPADSTLAYRIDNTAIATVDANGNITGVAAGKTLLQVTATTADGQKTATKTVQVTILALPEIVANDFTIYQTRTEPLLYLATPLSTVKTFASGDEAIATIDANGKVTGVATGTTTIKITATTADGQKTTDKTVNVTVLALPLVNAEDQSLYVDDTKVLAYVASPADSTMSFSVADEAVATVDADGTITGHAAGTTDVTIMATTADGRESASRTIVVTVLALPSVSATLDALYVGESANTVVTAAPSDGTLTYVIDDEAIATVDANGVVHGVAAGSAELTVTLTTADGQKSVETTVAVVVLGLPTISVEPLKLYMDGSASAAIQYTPDDATVTYQIADQDVAQVAENGLVTPVAPGTTAITVTVTTDDGKKSVSAESEVTVLALPTLRADDATVYLDDSLKVPVEYTPADASLQYQSSDATVATIAGDGSIVPKKPGSALITVTLTTADGVKVITDTATVTVLALPTITVADAELYVGDSADLARQFTPADGTITYTSSDESIATVDANGQVRAVAAGNTTVTATITTADGRKTATDQAQITVTALPDISAEDVTLYKSDTAAIQLTANSDDYLYQYSSSDMLVATVSSDGQVTGISPGTSTITIAATTKDGRKSTTITITVTVLELPTVSADLDYLYVGDTSAASVQFSPEDATITYQIADENIATVDESGNVSGIAAGNTVLSVKATTLDGKKSTTTDVAVIVKALPTVSAGDLYLYASDVVSSSAVYTPADAQVSYAVANTAIAAVDASGNVRGVSAGTTSMTITVTTADGRKTATDTVQITVYPLPEASVAGQNIYVGDQAALQYSASPLDATLAFASSDDAVLTIDAAGNITAVSAGSATVTLTVTTADGQKTAVASNTVTVLNLPQVSATGQTLYVGATAAMQVDFSPANATAQYSSSDQAVATVDAGSGKITAVSPGTTTVTITVTTVDGQKTATASAVITVLALPDIDADDKTLYVGDSELFSDTINPDYTYTFAMGDTAIATIDEAGNITAVAPGTTTLKITATTSDGRETTDETITVTVLALPTITIGSQTIYTDETATITPAVTPGTAVVSYGIDDSAIAAINSSGLITPKKAGVTNISATATTSDGLKNASTTAVLTVLDLPTVTVTDRALYAGDVQSSGAVVSPADAKVTYQIADSAIASVDGAGNITGIKAGTTELTVLVTTSDGRRSVQATASVSVYALPTLRVADQAVYVGDTAALSPVFTPTDAVLSYQSSNTNVVTVDNAGQLRAVSAGEATVTVMLTTADGQKTTSADAKITVLALPQVSLQPQVFYVGDAVAAAAQSSPDDALLTYSSSDSDVVSVAADGTMTGVGAGTAKVTVQVTTADGLKTARAEATMTVYALPAIEVAAMQLYVGDNAQPQISANKSDMTYAYAVLDTSVASVDNAGKVTAVKAGTTALRVVATTADGLKNTSVDVPLTVLDLPTLQVENSTLYVGDYQTPVLQYTPANAKVQLAIADQTVATVNGNNRIHGEKAGSTNLTITVTTADDIKTVQQTVVVTVLDLPTLSLTPRTLYAGDVQASGAVFTPADAQLSYQIADDSVAAVDAEGNITGLSAGTTELTVVAATSDGKKSVTEKTSVTVYALPTAGLSDKTIYAGDAQALSFNYTPATASVRFESSNEAAASVDNNGVLNAKSPGSATITLSVTTVDGQKTATAEATVTVLALPELTLSPISVYIGDTTAANPDFSPADALITYEIDNPDIAEVAANGTITAIAPGTANLSVTATTADKQKSVTKTTTVTVLAQPTLSVANQSLYLNDTKTVALDYTPSDATISYATADAAIATVDAAGMITAHRIGVTTLTVTLTTADGQKILTKTVQLEVLALPAMVFPDGAPVLYAGDNARFSVNYIPRDATISYQIEDTSIASVDANGLIQANKSGATAMTVTITTADGEKTASKTIPVTVLALPTVDISPVSVYVDNTANAAAAYSPADATITYTSADPSVAELNAQGVAQGLRQGNTDYTATATTVDGRKTINDTDVITVLPLPTLSVSNQTLYLDDSKAINPVISPQDGIVSYQVADGSIAAIDSNGTITAKKAGTTAFTVTVTTPDGLQTVTVDATITVLPLPTLSVINAADINVLYQNDTAQLQVQKTPADATLAYTVADNNILDVTDKGVVTAKAVGATTVTITATTADGQKQAETAIGITVKSLPELTVSDEALYVGDASALAIAYSPADAVLSYQSDNEPIATVDSFGTITAIATGTAKITVTLTTADGKKTLEQTITVTVQALPTVSFTDQSIYMGDTDTLIFEKTPENVSVNYTVADPTILIIDGNGQIHPLQVGKTSVQLKVTTADGKKTAEAEAILEVLPLPEVAASDYVLYSGDTIPFVTTYKPSDATLSYTVADETIATIAGDGTITGKNAGSTQATVTATTADGIKSASKTVKITVYPLPTLNITNQFTYIGNEKAVRMSYLPSDAAVTYAIADPAIAEVTPDGTLIGVAEGKTQLTVTVTTADGFKETTATVDVNVLPLPDIKADDVTVYTGDTQALQPEYAPDDAQISYQVADPAVADVDAAGNVTGKKAGTTELTITLTTSDGEQAAETTITITVLALPSITAKDLQVAVGESKNLDAVYLPEDATVEYLSSDENIAYVYNDEAGHTSGEVFGVSVGTTTVNITVRTADGEKYTETNVTITVTGEGNAIAPNSPTNLDGKTLIFGLPLTGQNELVGISGVVLILSGGAVWFLVTKRRKKE